MTKKQIKTKKSNENVKQRKYALLQELISPDRSKLLSFEDAEQFYRDTIPKRFGPTDIVLLLLGVYPDKPITGKTMLMKQTFLSERELELELQDLQFIGHRFGPHSFLMENIFRNMEFLGYIEKKGTSHRPKYFLGTKSKKDAEKLLSTLSIQEKEKIQDCRKSWDELGNEGILRFVYNNYEDFINKSIVKKRYVSANWKKGVKK